METPRLGMDTYMHFTLQDIIDNSADGFFYKVKEFCREQMPEPKPEFESIEQAVGLCQAVAAHGQWSRRLGFAFSEETRRACRKEMDTIAADAEPFVNAPGERSPDMRLASEHYRSASFRFPPIRSKGGVKVLYWDRMRPKILASVTRAAFLSDNERSEQLLNAFDSGTGIPDGPEDYVKTLEGVRDELKRIRAYQETGLQTAEDAGGDVGAALAFSELDCTDAEQMSAEAAGRSGIAVVLYSGKCPQGLRRNTIPVEFNPWDYPKREGLRETGTDWWLFAQDKAAEVVNGRISVGLSRDDVSLALLVSGDALDGYRPNELSEFFRHFLDALRNDIRQYRTTEHRYRGRDYRKRNYTANLDGCIDLGTVIVAGSGIPQRSAAGAAQLLGIDCDILAPRGWNGDRKAFMAAFPPVPMLGKYTRKRSEHKAFAADVAARRTAEKEFISAHSKDAFAPVVPEFVETDLFGTSLRNRVIQDVDIILAFAPEGRMAKEDDLPSGLSHMTILVEGKGNPERIADSVYAKMSRDGFPKKDVTMAVVGTRRLSASGQGQADVLVHGVLKRLLLGHGISFRRVRCTGDDGIPMAAATAARRLGIPVTVLAPRGFAYRTDDGNILLHREGFIGRYGQVPVDDDCLSRNMNEVQSQVSVPEDIDLSLSYHEALYGGSARLPFTLGDICRMTSCREFLNLREFISVGIRHQDGTALGIDNCQFICIEHSMQALRAYCGIVFAEDDRTRGECLDCLQTLTCRNVTMAMVSRCDSILDGCMSETASRHFGDIVGETLQAAVTTAYLCNPSSLERLLSTSGGRITDSGASGGRSLMSEVLSSVRESLPEILKEESKRLQAERESNLERQRRRIEMEGGEYALDENVIRIREEDEGFNDALVAWAAGTVCRTGQVTVDSDAGSIANERLFDREDFRYETMKMDQWEFSPNRFYLSYEDGAFYLQAARYVGEYGFGEYTNYDNREIRNGDKVRVADAHVERIASLFLQLKTKVSEPVGQGQGMRLSGV